jgi:hypothetical protein
MGASGTSGTAETRRIVVDGEGRITVSSESAYTSTRIDDNGAGTVWIGNAEVGSSEGSAVWRIKQIVDNDGTVDIKWADGDSSADNVWTGHGTLSYS